MPRDKIVPEQQTAKWTRTSRKEGKYRTENPQEPQEK